jgi:GDP-4-dehydro-6-deoxy-D-mannose reductase
MMHVFITGISGFVGAHLARHLLAAGHRVSGTFLDEPPRLPGAELCHLDLEAADELERVLAAARPDHVVHLAALSHVGRSWERMPEYFRVNVLGTERLLAAVAGARVVYASSAEIYGAVPEAEQPIDEDRAPAPASPYALTKAAAERLALAAGAVVVRLFNLVGPGQAPAFALPSFARQLAAVAAGVQAPVLRVGNLSARRDFLHVGDGAAALALLLERGEPGTTYQVASGSSRSLREALELLIAASGVEVALEPDPARFRPVDIPLLCGRSERLRGLGWAPRRCLEEAVTELWREAVEVRAAQ